MSPDGWEKPSGNNAFIFLSIKITYACMTMSDDVIFCHAVVGRLGRTDQRTVSLPPPKKDCSNSFCSGFDSRTVY